MEKKTYICDRCNSDQVIAGKRNYESAWVLILDMEKAYLYDKHICSLQCACLIDHPVLESVAIPRPVEYLEDTESEAEQTKAQFAHILDKSGDDIPF